MSCSEANFGDKNNENDLDTRRHTEIERKR